MNKLPKGVDFGLGIDSEDNEDRVVDPSHIVPQDEFVVNGSKVQVLLCRWLSGKYFIRVRLSSKRKIFAGVVWTQADVEFDRDITKKIEAAGGALAEEQNEKHADNHDPSDCARAAKEAWYKLAFSLKQKGLFG